MSCAYLWGRSLLLHLLGCLSFLGGVSLFSVSFANIPAAYLACEGAEERAPCSLPGPQYGVCIRDTLCTDPPETSVNECVICVDECWASEDGLECIRPWTGEYGVCESQERCTDKLETSFDECRRCVEGEPWQAESEDLSMEPSSSTCDQGLIANSSIILKFWWLHIIICLMILSRRLVKRYHS